MQRWGAEQELGIEGLGGPVQRIREQAVFVHFQPDHLKTQRTRQGQHAGIAERFGQQGVARACDGAQHASQRVLCAVRHHHAVGSTAGSKPAQPLRPRDAVSFGTGLGLVTKHFGHALRVLAQRSKRLAQCVNLIGGDGHVMRQINRGRPR